MKVYVMITTSKIGDNFKSVRKVFGGRESALIHLKDLNAVVSPFNQGSDKFYETGTHYIQLKKMEVL